MKKYLVIILFTQYLLSQTLEHFLLPKDGNSAENSIIHAIQNAQTTIDVAMFMVTNKKLTNALKKRAKKGKIQIRLIADKSYDFDHQKVSKIKNLLGYKNISVFTLKGLKKKKNKYGIMHAKLIVIDNVITYVGSTNWTNSAFHTNYEILIKITDITTAKLYQYYFNDMINKSKKYK